MGTGPAWLVRSGTTAVLGNKHRRFRVGTPVGRLLSFAVSQALRGFGRKLLKDTSTRLGTPVGQIPAQAPTVVPVNRFAVGSRLSYHPRFKGSVPFPRFSRASCPSKIRKAVCPTATLPIGPENKLKISLALNLILRPHQTQCHRSHEERGEPSVVRA